ncbi:MAG: hypothetical protein WCD11_14190 [Solirubrobacteraceae bacterium]
MSEVAGPGGMLPRADNERARHLGDFTTKLVAPGAGPHSWLLIVCLPIAGGLVVGLMARFGSEKIRGHGMPEAIEAILTRGSRIEPRVAILKPPGVRCGTRDAVIFSQVFCEKDFPPRRRTWLT